MKSMAKKRQKQKIIRSETQDTVMMSKKEVGNEDPEEISNSPSLPHDIIVNDILTRVPIDSLMRFKCVCKSWSQLIANDSDFMKLFSRTNSAHGFIELSSSYTDDDTELDRDTDERNGVIKSNGVVFYNIEKNDKRVYHFRPETGLIDRKLVIRCALNGLVLISRRERAWFSHHVFNPITGYSVKLPIMNDITRENGGVYLHLTYDSATEKYKFIFSFRRRTKYAFKIITVGVQSDSWRNVVAPSYPRFRKENPAVFANGSLSWLTHDRNDSDFKADQCQILSLDVSEEKFYTIDYPNGVSRKSELKEMGGSLCFFDYVSTGTIKLWVLKENKEKWNKRNQHNEWVEYNFDILQNNNVPKLFNNFESCQCVEIVKYPTLRIIFWARPESLFCMFYDSTYTLDFYSYDVESKRFDSIPELRDVFVKWDLKSLVHLHSTLAG